jgi:hypothetical protein
MKKKRTVMNADCVMEALVVRTHVQSIAPFRLGLCVSCCFILLFVDVVHAQALEFEEYKPLVEDVQESLGARSRVCSIVATDMG